MLSRLRSLINKLSAPRVASDSSPGHMYSLLRHQALSYDRETLGILGPFPEPPPDAPAWGAVMEIGYPGFSGTLAAFSNGQTTLYNSDGMAVTSDHHNEQVRQANAKLIAAANKAIPYLKPRTSSAMPDHWQALFYVRTDTGNLATEATAEDFRNENHPLFSLFDAANEMLTQMKHVAAAQRKNDCLKRIARLNEAIARNPKKVELYAERAEEYADLGDFDKALAAFEEALLLTPVADAFLGRGTMHMRRGDITSALKDFSLAIELEPTNAMAYSNLAAAYSRLQDMDKALANYDLAIQHNPKYANSYANRAFAYYKLGRYEEGVADCNRALALRPDHANTYNNRGLCRAGLGDKEGARADFQRVLAFDPPAPLNIIEETLSGLHALDHPGEPMPVWKSPSVWVMP